MKKMSILLILVLSINLFVGCGKQEDAVVIQPDEMRIRAICELATLECYYHNVAKSTKEKGDGIQGIGEKDREFWIEYTGIAKIGIDMSDVKMTVSGEKITVFIPEAKVLSISVEQGSLTENSIICSQDGWNKNKITADDQAAAINDAQEKMRETAANDKMLMINAQERAKILIENYILQLGELSGVEYVITWEYEK